MGRRPGRCAAKASAFGIFPAGYGIAWFAGSTLIGLLFGVSLPVVVAFALIAELAAVPFFLATRRQVDGAEPQPDS